MVLLKKLNNNRYVLGVKTFDLNNQTYSYYLTRVDLWSNYSNEENFEEEEVVQVEEDEISSSATQDQETEYDTEQEEMKKLGLPIQFNFKDNNFGKRKKKKKRKVKHRNQNASVNKNTIFSNIEEEWSSYWEKYGSTLVEASWHEYFENWLRDRKARNKASEVLPPESQVLSIEINCNGESLNQNTVQVSENMDSGDSEKLNGFLDPSPCESLSLSPSSHTTNKELGNGHSELVPMDEGDGPHINSTKPSNNGHSHLKNGFKLDPLQTSETTLDSTLKSEEPPTIIQDAANENKTDTILDPSTVENDASSKENQEGNNPDTNEGSLSVEQFLAIHEISKEEFDNLWYCHFQEQYAHHYQIFYAARFPQDMEDEYTVPYIDDCQASASASASGSDFYCSGNESNNEDIKGALLEKKDDHPGNGENLINISTSMLSCNKNLWEADQIDANSFQKADVLMEENENIEKDTCTKLAQKDEIKEKSDQNSLKERQLKIINHISQVFSIPLEQCDASNESELWKPDSESREILPESSSSSPLSPCIPEETEKVTLQREEFGTLCIPSSMEQDLDSSTPFQLNQDFGEQPTFSSCSNSLVESNLGSKMASDKMPSDAYHTKQPSFHPSQEDIGKLNAESKPKSDDEDSGPEEIPFAKQPWVYIKDDQSIDESDAQDLSSTPSSQNLIVQKYETSTDRGSRLQICHRKSTRQTRYEIKEGDSTTNCDLDDMPEGLNPALRKYWTHRHSLFSRFEEGIWLDDESWYSVTPEKIAAHIAKRCTYDLIVDGFCGAGGNAIQFALNGSRVIAIDIDASKIKMARHNAEIYGVADKIEFLCGDFLTTGPSLKADAVFLSPPWGGVDYRSHGDPFPLSVIVPPVQDIFQVARLISPNIVFFAPKNSSIKQLLAFSQDGKFEAEQNYLDDKRKAITAYYGDLAEVVNEDGDLALMENEGNITADSQEAEALSEQNTCSDQENQPPKADAELSEKDDTLG